MLFVDMLDRIKNNIILIPFAENSYYTLLALEFDHEVTKKMNSSRPMSKLTQTSRAFCYSETAQNRRPTQQT